ncbi:MAG: SP family arabinose:H+ symporter-like MFS transporter [Paraglaciecola sp.]|jgi:SP family arabinose:H+ symporter-like MFS transporter
MTKNNSIFYTVYVALIVSLGGFLMGFDASVISGVVKFIEPEFNLSKIELGWAVASLSLTATFSMMIAGPLSDKYGRRTILKAAAILFFISAIVSAFAPSFLILVIARMVGGLGVGAALIIAPMYIAEIAPAKYRGRMVSLNQLNIVLGISVAFFTNYLILNLGDSQAGWAQHLHFELWNWRWMLGLEALPAILYFGCLFLVPESPRWLLMKGRDAEALNIMAKTQSLEDAQQDIALIKTSIPMSSKDNKVPISQLFKPAMRLVMIIGVSVAILQQITGINAVFFYAPMIFEQSGLGTDASFMQAIYVGLINVCFTILAIMLIDKIGRKVLLVAGVLGIAVSMFSLSYGFHSATYTLTEETIQALPNTINKSALMLLEDQTFNDDINFKASIKDLLGTEALIQHESTFVSSAIKMNQTLILVSLLSFVACFAVSLGPVMWVLFSELFPNSIRGVAISFVGLINSGVSFTVQLVFPWQLANVGTTITFALYGVFAIIGLAIILKYLPETKGKSLEELESMLIKE